MFPKQKPTHQTLVRFVIHFSNKHLEWLWQAFTVLRCEAALSAADFAFCVSNQDISVAIDTFQLPQRSRLSLTGKLSRLFECRCPRVSQRGGRCREGWATMQEAAEKQLPPAPARAAASPCAPLESHNGRGPRGAVRAAVLHGCPGLTRFSSRGVERRERSTYSCCATPVQTRGSCNLRSAVPLTYWPGMWRFGILCTSGLLLKPCYILKLG